MSVIRRVYRLENPAGQGPYAGDQKCSRFLRPHFDPDQTFKFLGYPDEVLKTLSRAQWIFGWRNKKLYNQFFKPGGQQQCRQLGFGCKIYYPKHAIALPDGQVMFTDPSRTHSELKTVYFELLIVLKVLSKTSA